MKNLMLVGAAVTMLAGCQIETKSTNVYDIKEVNNRTYLIDQESGKLSLVSGERVIELPKYVLPSDKKLAVKGSFKNKIQFNATTKQIEDRVYFTVNLENYVQQIDKKDAVESIAQVDDIEWFKKALTKSKYDRINLQFLDADGFRLAEETVDLNKHYTQVVNSEGIVSGLRYDGSFKVNPIILSRTKTLSYTYKLPSLDTKPSS